jgi:hypothetical protein
MIRGPRRIALALPLEELEQPLQGAGVLIDSRVSIAQLTEACRH